MLGFTGLGRSQQRLQAKKEPKNNCKTDNQNGSKNKDDTVFHSPGYSFSLNTRDNCQRDALFVLSIADGSHQLCSIRATPFSGRVPTQLPVPPSV
jgi:hypothetical protein